VGHLLRNTRACARGNGPTTAAVEFDGVIGTLAIGINLKLDRPRLVVGDRPLKDDHPSPDINFRYTLAASIGSAGTVTRSLCTGPPLAPVTATSVLSP
jgi:hypothetical protein